MAALSVDSMADCSAVHWADKWADSSGNLMVEMMVAQKAVQSVAR